MWANIHKFYHPKAVLDDIRPAFPHKNMGEGRLLERGRLLRNDFHFPDVYRSVNFIGWRAKSVNPKGVHVNFASDPMSFILR